MIPQIKEVNFGPNTANDYATLHQATVNLSTMGDRTITTQVRIDGDVVPDFTGWELEFRGERFILPTREPQARKDTSTKNSLIDLTFYSWPVYELKRYFFVEMSSTTSGTAIADKYDASLALNLENFVDAFNLVLDHYFNGRIQISLFGQGQGIYSTDPVFFEINYTKLWEVLQKVYEMYNVRWWFDYDSASDIYLIKMGYTADSIDDHDFSYGYKGGLLSFERTVQSDDLVNILLGRGGEKNLPYRYFKRTDPDNPGWTADPDAIPELANIYFDRLHDVNFRWYVRGWMTNPTPNRDRSWEQEGYVYPTYSIDSDSPYYFAYQKGATDAKFNPVEYVKDDESIAAHGEVWGALDDNDDIYPTIQGVTVNPYGRIDEAVAISQIETDDISAYASAAAVETTIKDMYVSEQGNTVLNYTVYSKPFTIAQGEIGNVTYRPFSKETVYPNFVYYDTTRSTLVAEPLSGGSDQSGTASYDESTGLYAVSGIPAGTYRLKLNLVLRVDSPATAVNGTFGIENVVLTTSAANTNAWKPTFDIWVKNLWQTTQGNNESNKDYAERVWGPILGDRLGDEAKIVFSTGAMSISQDYEFVIADYPVPDRTKTLNGVPSEWKITVYKSDAEYQATGLYIPNASSAQPLAGDKFFFVGIDMPFQYVEWAEERLNQYKTDNLEGMSEISPTWTLKLDKVRINSLEDEDYGQKLADRLDAGVMIRTTDPRFTHGDILSLYIQSITWTWNEPSKNNPYIVPDVEVILADKVSTVESPISRLENDVDVISQTYVQSGDVEAVVRRVAGALFLKKTGESDSSSSPTTFSSKVTSRNFRKGGIGGAGWGLYEDNSRKFSQSSPATRADVSDEEETVEPRTVLEVDRLVVREEMEVNNLVINQISARGGREIISAARIETTLVRETSTSYVCYFDQKQNSVANLFQVNDIAYGQVWSADNTELRFYKMLVTAVDVNSITLAKAGRYGSGSPQEGDVIVQYGNTTDARRQYVVIRDVVGGGHDRMLSGLNSVSAEGVEYYYAGVETGDTPRWFVGDREAEYAEYKDGVLNISGRLAVTSQLEKSDGSYVALSEYLNQLQDQVDGNIQTWFNAGEPSPLKDDPTATPNYPASEWETATDKNKHLGDLYYNETTGKAYRYQLIGGNYVWGMISDEEIAEALRAAQAAAAAAATAQADADAAKARMDEWASDGVISPTEKQGIKDEIARIDSDHSNINAAYTLYGLGSPTAYNESYTAYRAQLVTLSASEPETITIPESFATNQISYYTQRTASLNAVDDAVKTGLTNLSTEIAGYNYLKRALGETTLVQGGLVLTSLIQLGQTESGTFNVYSGINGTFDQTLPDPSRSIAAWYGGPMTDHEADPTSTTYAKSLFRMDGSGYLAGGMLNWGVENGQAFLNLNGEAVVGGLGGTTLNDIANLMFEVVQYKSGHYAAKLKTSAYYGGNLVPLDGLYAEGWVSSGGLSDQGGGGGGSSYLKDLLDVSLPAVSQIGLWQGLLWDGEQWVNGDVERPSNRVTSVSSASTNTQYPTAKAVYDIVNTMLSSAMRFQGVTSTALVDGSTTNPVVVDGASYTATKGDVVVRSDVGLEFLWTGAKWQQLGDETSYAKKTVTITGSGYLTGGGNLEAARTIDIAEEIKAKIDNGATAYASLGNYLPLTGGTITGPLTIQMPWDTKLIFNNTDGDFYTKLSFQENGTEYGSIIINGAGFFYGSQTVWHAGNDGAGSGLDADLLDGIDSNGFMRSFGTSSTASSPIDLNDIPSPTLKQVRTDYRWSNMPQAGIGAVMHLPYSPDWIAQIFAPINSDSKLYVRNRYNGTTWSAWHEVAYTDSNVASATKLQTARTIWGQSFDGTGNVSGLLTSVTGIHMTGNLMVGVGEVGPYLNKNGVSIHNASNAWIADALKFDAAGNASFYHNVGIGTTSPAYKLDVAGDVRATGKVYIGSTGAYFEVDSNGYLHTNFPLYSDSWVSSGGVSATGGSGAVGYLHDLLDVDDDLNPSTGQALVWDGTEWAAGGDISGYEKTDNKVTSISSLSTDTQYPSAKAVYTALAGYLPLAGGVMTGVEKMVAGATPRTSGSYLSFVHYSDSSEVRDADLSAKNDGFLGLYARNGIALRPGTGSAFDTAKGLSVTASDITFNDTSLINTYAKKSVTIKGSGYLSGGGNLEANRTIDIAESIKTKIDNGATAYASLGNYLPLTGGTINGALTVRGGRTWIGSNAGDGSAYENYHGIRWGYHSVDHMDFYENEFNFYGNGGGTPILKVNGSTVWHASNDGSGSGLDADLLDGKQSSAFYQADLDALMAEDAAAVSCGSRWVYKELGSSNPVPQSYGSLMTLGASYYAAQLFTTHDASRAFLRGRYNSAGQITCSAWHELAFTDSNVASATKLENSRLIWGQRFDGSKDVNGKFFFDGGNATLKIFSAAGMYPNYGDETVVFQSAIDRQDPETSTLPAQIPERSVISFQPRGGRVGVGTTSPAYKLDVNGSVAFGSSGACDVYLRRTGLNYIRADASSNASIQFTINSQPLMMLHRKGVSIGHQFERDYALDVAGTVNINPSETAVPAIRIVASGTSGNHGINYVDASGNLKARFGVNSSTGLFQIFANGDVTMRSGGTSTSGFTISSPATSGNVTSYMMYPAIAGAITLNSDGAFSALGNGADLASPGTPMRSVSTKVIYLASGIYIYYDTVHNCIRTNAPIVSDSYISAGGVSTT